MEVVGAVASVVGIVSLGIEISQILQRQVDEVANADETISKFIVELQVTASVLSQLSDILTEDEKLPNNRIFNNRGREDVGLTLKQCNVIFRDVAVLIAKSGELVLVTVDDFQRRIAKETERDFKKGQDPVELKIELSKIDHLCWPWRLRKVEQHIAELERQKSTIGLFVGIANLARSRKGITRAPEENEKNVENQNNIDDDSDDETLVDEVFYQNRSKLKAESKLNDVLVSDIEPDARDNGPGRQDHHQDPFVLLQNWPYIADSGEIVTMSDILALRVFLSAWTYGPQYSDGFSEASWVESLLTEREIHDTALKFSQSSKKKDNLVQKMKRLPIAYQKSLSNLGDSLWGNGWCRPRVLYIDYRRSLWKRFLQKAKTLLPLYNGSLRNHEFFVIIAQVEQRHSHRLRANGPAPWPRYSEPVPVITPSSRRPPRQNQSQRHRYPSPVHISRQRSSSPEPTMVRPRGEYDDRQPAASRNSITYHRTTDFADIHDPIEPSHSTSRQLIPYRRQPTVDAAGPLVVRKPTLDDQRPHYEYYDEDDYHYERRHIEPDLRDTSKNNNNNYSRDPYDFTTSIPRRKRSWERERQPSTRPRSYSYREPDYAVDAPNYYRRRTTTPSAYKRTRSPSPPFPRSAATQHDRRSRSRPVVVIGGSSGSGGSGWVDTSEPPSRDEKMAVAEDLLRLWTTTYEGEKKNKRLASRGRSSSNKARRARTNSSGLKNTRTDSSDSRGERRWTEETGLSREATGGGDFESDNSRAGAEARRPPWMLTGGTGPPPVFRPRPTRPGPKWSFEGEEVPRLSGDGGEQEGGGYGAGSSHLSDRRTPRRSRSVGNINEAERELALVPFDARVREEREREQRESRTEIESVEGYYEPHIEERERRHVTFES